MKLQMKRVTSAGLFARLRKEMTLKIAAIHPLKSGGFEIHLVQVRLPPAKDGQIAHPPP